MLIVIFLLIFLCGYKVRNVWNEGAVETECKILGLIVKTGTTYTESCRCRQACGTSCSTVCDTCKLPYYSGLLNITYLETYNVAIVVIDNKYKDANSTLAELQSNYQINSIIPCYYQQNDHTNLKLQLDDVAAWFYCSFIPIILIGILWGTWIILEIVRGCRMLCLYCRSERTRKVHEKRQKDTEMAVQEEDNIEENKSVEVVASEVSEVTVK